MADDTLVLILGLLAVSLVMLKGIRYFQRDRRVRKSVAIVVLGDIGRSPRMLYHATSFAERGFRTSIVAYRGESGKVSPGPSSELISSSSP